MNSFLDRIFLGNTVESFLWAIGVILLVLILNKAISKALVYLSGKFFKTRWKTFDQQNFIDLILYPLGLFLFITVSIISFYRLNYPPEFHIHIYKYPLQKILITIAIVIQILSFAWLLMRVIDFVSGVLQRRANLELNKGGTQLIVFFRDFIKVIIGVIGIMVVLNQAFGYNISSLITGLSIVGAAIALSLRESLENLIASFVIFFDKPFAPGDFVRVQNVAGVVERIGLRSTRVRTVEKSYVTVPNKQMVDSILDNVSLRSQIRGEINLLLDFDTPLPKIEQLQNDVKAYISGVEEIQSSKVLFNDIRSQGFLLFIEIFTPPIDFFQFQEIKQKLNYFILERMETLEIKISENRERN